MSLEALPQDLRTVSPDELLVRYIHWRQTAEDGSLTSAAFRDENLSVDRLRLLPPGPLTKAYQHPRIGAVQFRAADCSADRVEATVVPDPDLTQGDLAHAVVSVDGGRKQRDRLASHLKQLVAPQWDAADARLRRRVAEATERAS